MNYINLIVKERHKRLKELRRLALEEVKLITQILVKYGAKRVILFGSLTKEGLFNQNSDIDIVVEGLGEQYFKAYGHALRESSFRLDIKPFEDLPQVLREQILREGLKLYE